MVEVTAVEVAVAHQAVAEPPLVAVLVELPLAELEAALQVGTVQRQASIREPPAPRTQRSSTRTETPRRRP